MADKNIAASQKAPYAKSAGLPGLSNVANKRGMDNNCPLRALNATESDVYDIASVDPQNLTQIGGSYFRRLLRPVPFSVFTTAKITTTPLFVNNDTDTLELAAITCTFSVTNGAALTAYVSKESATSGAPGSGPSCQSGTFNLNATANTVQEATMAGSRGYPTLVINPGEQLSLKLSTTTTSLAGLCITLWFRGLNGPVATFVRSDNGDIADGTMFLSPMSGLKVREVAMRWGTAGSDSGTVTASVEKETGTQAPAGGTIILAAAQSVKGTANATVFPALAASAATYTLAQTDRLSVDFAGTLTDLADIIVTVFFEPVAQDWITVPVSMWDDADAEKDFFISDGFYRLIGTYWTWSTAGGGSTTLQIEKASGTTAPAGGTAILDAAIDTSATANTPLVGIPIAANPFTPTLANLDRLSTEHTGTTTAIAGLFGTVVLSKF